MRIQDKTGAWKPVFYWQHMCKELCRQLLWEVILRGFQELFLWFRLAWRQLDCNELGFEPLWFCLNLYLLCGALVLLVWIKISIMYTIKATLCFACLDWSSGKLGGEPVLLQLN